MAKQAIKIQTSTLDMLLTIIIATVLEATTVKMALDKSLKIVSKILAFLHIKDDMQ